MAKKDNKQNEELMDETINMEETATDNTAEQQTEAEEANVNNEVQQIKDKYLRLFSDFENYKKRTAKETLDLRRTASKEVMMAIIPVLDDFERARQNAAKENTEETFSEGVQLVYDKLFKTLKSKGLDMMKSTGEVFDSELHEAITKIPAPTPDLKGKVIDTIEFGYTLNDQIIRYAKVVVGE
jgi:molecular chaperone GrpE